MKPNSHTDETVYHPREGSAIVSDVTQPTEVLADWSQLDDLEIVEVNGVPVQSCGTCGALVIKDCQCSNCGSALQP
ncbi:MAG: hypothetical protein F6K31_07415 [Symploca sp. SIO2G7]|nr:hypothetical protein [Symploca sp. SIO2G7]